MTRLIGGHALLNLESAVALAFLLALYARSRTGVWIAPGDGDRNRAWAWLAICGAVLLVYWRALDSPFVFDDYTHIADARHADWRSVVAAFGGAETKPGLFFRPLGALLYWLNYLVAGENVRWWHAGSLALHAGVSCLLFAFAREIKLGFAGSFCAALLFALSGVATETAVWIDARFDLIATSLTLLSLILICRYCASGRALLLAAACLAALGALLSKESAFCLPLLVACLWFFLTGREEARRLIAACGTVTVLSIVVFAYRWWALGGMGGYGEAHFSAARLANAILIRDWTILFFPVNWSQTPNGLLLGLMAAAPLGLAFGAWLARLPRRVLAGGVAMTVAAALPAQHLLLIGSDLANSRYLYLPAVGWAIVWGAVVGSIDQPQRRAWLAVWMVAWNLTMLRHDLAFWLRVPAEARQVCADFGATVVARQESVIVSGLPSRKDGVVFLANGFAECVSMNSGAAVWRVKVGEPANYRWNAEQGKISAAN